MSETTTRYGTFSDEDIKLCVKLGSKWLDEESPNWASRIKFQDLEMTSCTNCIIGQAIGDYDEVLYELGYSDEWAAENGFFAPMHYDENGSYDNQTTLEHFEKLEQAWKVEVMNRLD